MRNGATTFGMTLLLAALWLPATAAGHGPCGCLDPRIVQAGSGVSLTDGAGRQDGDTGYPAYRVVFNPRPTDLGIAPMYLASAYRADAATTTVLSRSRHSPTRRGRFRVPTSTLPGVYMVLIFDGDEAGAHNTWDYLHVTDWDDKDTGAVVAETERRGAPTTHSTLPEGQAPDGPGAPVSLTVALGVAAFFLGGAAGTWRSRRHRRGGRAAS